MQKANTTKASTGFKYIKIISHGFPLIFTSNNVFTFYLFFFNRNFYKENQLDVFDYKIQKEKNNVHRCFVVFLFNAFHSDIASLLIRILNNLETNIERRYITSVECC